MPKREIINFGQALLDNPDQWLDLRRKYDFLGLVTTSSDLIELLKIIRGMSNLPILYQIIGEKRELLADKSQVIAAIRACRQCAEFILYTCDKISLFNSDVLIIHLLHEVCDIDLSQMVLLTHKGIKAFTSKDSLCVLLTGLHRNSQFSIMEQILFAPDNKIILITEPQDLVQLMIMFPHRAQSMLFDYRCLRLFNTDEDVRTLFLTIEHLGLSDLAELLYNIFSKNNFDDTMFFLRRHPEYLSELMYYKRQYFITSVDELCAFVRVFPLAARLVILDYRKIGLLKSTADCERLCGELNFHGGPSFMKLDEVRSCYARMMVRRNNFFRAVSPSIKFAIPRVIIDKFVGNTVVNQLLQDECAAKEDTLRIKGIMY